MAKKKSERKKTEEDKRRSAIGRHRGASAVENMQKNADDNNNKLSKGG